MKKTPLRTCIVCREKKEKRKLIRIVRDKENQTVFFDKTGKANGRGAYICGSDKCIETLGNVKMINNILNVNVKKEDMENVKEGIKKHLKEEVLN